MEALINKAQQFQMNKSIKHILVCRRDSLGDVVLALIACGIIKEHYPDCKITFLGRTYTQDAALSSIHVDNFINYDDWQGKSDNEVTSDLKARNIDAALHIRPDKHISFHVKRAKIPIRAGTTHRLFHWFTCNKLYFFSRKNSALHEAQLNLKLLKAIGIKQVFDKSALYHYYGMKRIAPLNQEVNSLIDHEKFNLVLHPRSHGSSLEWSSENFVKLINMLDPAYYKIFITGSEAEGDSMKSWIEPLGDKVINLCGKLSLNQLIPFIHQCDGLIASSTGPVHIAAAVGINTLGLYTDIKTKDAGRWGPIGEKAEYFQCANADMDLITPKLVSEKVQIWRQQVVTQLSQNLNTGTR